MYTTDTSGTSQLDFIFLHVELKYPQKLPEIVKFLVGHGSCYGPCIQA